MKNRILYVVVAVMALAIISTSVFMFVGKNKIPILDETSNQGQADTENDSSHSDKDKPDTDGESNVTGTQQGEWGFSKDNISDGSLVEKTDESYTEDSNHPRKPPLDIDVPGGYTPVCDKCNYEKLDRSKRRIYDDLYEGIYSFEPVVKFKMYQEVTDKDLKEIFEMLLDDNPQIFWVSKSYSYIASDKNITEIRLEYNVESKAAMLDQRKELSDAVTKALSILKADMSEYERELALHDYLCEVVNYHEYFLENPDFNSTAAKEHQNVFTSYGALVQGKAVCEGYSRAFKLLLNEVGVKSSLIRGMSNGQSHMWNIVEIDGTKQHVDTTWDDQSQGYTHTYFNVTDEFINLSHNNFQPVGAVDDAFNYYKQRGLCFDKYDAETYDAIQSELKHINEEGRTILEIRFVNSSDYRSCLTDLMDSNKIITMLHSINKTSSKPFMLKAQQLLRPQSNEECIAELKLYYK